MKRFVGAIALACMFSATAFAGEIPSTGAPAPQASSPVVMSVVLTILRLVVR